MSLLHMLILLRSHHQAHLKKQYPSCLNIPPKQQVLQRCTQGRQPLQGKSCSCTNSNASLLKSPQGTCVLWSGLKGWEVQEMSLQHSSLVRQDTNKILCSWWHLEVGRPLEDSEEVIYIVWVAEEHFWTGLWLSLSSTIFCLSNLRCVDYIIMIHITRTRPDQMKIELMHFPFPYECI